MKKIAPLVLSFFLFSGLANAKCRDVVDQGGLYKKMCNNKKKDIHPKLYIGPNISYSAYNKIDNNFSISKTKRSFPVGLSLGVRQNGVDLELEGMYAKSTLTSQDNLEYRAESFTALANLSVSISEFDNGVNIILGAGLGGTYFRHRSINNMQDNPGHDLAYQAFIGLMKAFDNSISIDGKIRVGSLGDFKNSSGTAKHYNLIITTGLKYSF